MQKSAQISDKIALLKKNGYEYLFDRDIFFNNEKRKCFSLEFIEDNSIDYIESILREPGSKEITFYFNYPPSDTVRSEIVKQIESLA